MLIYLLIEFMCVVELIDAQPLKLQSRPKTPRRKRHSEPIAHSG